MPGSDVGTRRNRRIIGMDLGTQRRYSPRHRRGHTQEFAIAEHTGQLTTNSYPDGALGELWVGVEPSNTDTYDHQALNGLLASLCAAVNLGLQHGVPLEHYVQQYLGMCFAPAGPVSDPDITHASSVPDYVFRRVALDHLDFATRSRLGVRTAVEIGGSAE